MVMNTNTERPTVRERPTIRDWVGREPFTGDAATAAQYYGFTPTERQLGILDQAVARGYLWDPDPELGDFRTRGDRPRDQTSRRWPAPHSLEWKGWEYQAHYREWQARCAAGGRPWGGREWVQAAPPRLYTVWDDYCEHCLDRPSVAAGRFIPEHWHGDQGTLGVRLSTNCHDGSRWWLEDEDWAALLKLAVGGVCTIHLDHWIYSDSNILAVQTYASQAEALAAALTDRLLEVLKPGWDTPGWDLSRKAINS
jgi:hypothetical protein